MRLISALLSIFRPSNDDVVLDHVPVSSDSNVAAKKLARARKKAAERHGKQFRTHAKKDRETPKSRQLLEIEAITSPKSAIVTDIRMAK